jgi:hypothetical protein
MLFPCVPWIENDFSKSTNISTNDLIFWISLYSYNIYLRENQGTSFKFQMLDDLCDSGDSSVFVYLMDMRKFALLLWD